MSSAVTNPRIAGEGRDFIRLAWYPPSANEASQTTGYKSHVPLQGRASMLHGMGYDPQRFVKIWGLVPAALTRDRMMAPSGTRLRFLSPWVDGRPGEGRLSAFPFSPSQSDRGRINLNVRGARYRLQVELEICTQCRIDIKGGATGDRGGALRDPRVWMVNSDRNVIPGAFNNNGGTRKNARLSFTSETAGTCRVWVGTKRRTVPATYTVSMPELTGSIP